MSLSSGSGTHWLEVLCWTCAVVKGAFPTLQESGTLSSVLLLQVTIIGLLNSCSVHNTYSHYIVVVYTNIPGGSRSIF